MGFTYFSNEQVIQIWRAAIETHLADAGNLSYLSNGVDRPFIDSKIRHGCPAETLLSQLQTFNRVERVAGGRSPFVTWLSAAVAQTMSLPQGRVFRHALDEAVARVTGEPLMIDPAKLPEFYEEIYCDKGPLLPSFLSAGQAAASAVAQISVPRYDGGREAVVNGLPAVYRGVGWLIAPDLLATNHHVLNARVQGEGNATPEDLRLQVGHAVTRFECDGEESLGGKIDILSLEVFDTRLDYSIVRLVRRMKQTPLLLSGAKLGRPQSGYVPVNVILCTDEGVNKIAVRNNLVSGSTETDLRYFTYTKSVVPGSPVFDDQWRLIALHRSSVAAEGVRYMGGTTALLNIGTHVSAILGHLRAAHPAILRELNVAGHDCG